MMNKAIITLVSATVDSLKKLKNNAASYFAIVAMLFGSTFGNINSANATAYTLSANDLWGDAGTLNNGSAIDNPTADDTVVLAGHTLEISDTDGAGKDIGAITDGSTGSINIISKTTTDLTNVTASFVVGANMTLTMDATNKAAISFTVDNAGATNTIGGTLALTSLDAAANDGILMDINGALAVTGATTLTANSGGDGSDVALTVDKAATFTGGVVLNDTLDGLATLNFNENNDVDITGVIQGAVDGEGTLVVAGNTKDFKSAIGSGDKKLLLVDINGATTVFDSTVDATTIDVDGTVTFTGAVTATTVTIDAATAMSADLVATTTTMGAGDVLTAAGNVTGAVVLSNGASSLALTGADVTVTGDINAAGTTDAGIVAVTGAKVTFAGNLGAASGTNIDILTVAANKRAVITETANFIDRIDMAALGELEITKAVVGGTVFSATGTTWVAGDFAATSKIYLPVNLVGGETLTFIAGAADADGTSVTISTALVDTALIDYTSANDGGTHTISATNKAASAVATDLAITTQAATGLFQALASVVNDTTVDGTAEDVFYNALTGNGGLATTDVTSIALQVAPQTDTISGSAVATRAMTGTVQGIVSNRMASLRSGDAFVTGMSAGNGMSANSGFIQAFGSESEQKNTVKSGATSYGYDGETSGLAIGFDGMTDDGSTIGLSASYSTTDVDGKGTGKSKNSIDSYTVSVYADKATEIGYIEGSLTYGINENTSSRIVNTAGLSRTYAGIYDSEQLSLKVGGGVPNEVIANGFVTPFASATGTIMSSDAYTETSTTASDALRLKIAQDDVTSLVGTVGVKAHLITDKGTPMISLSVNNEFGDTTINSSNSYTGGGSKFVTSTDVEELSATLGLGYSFGNDVTSLNLNYEANANEDDYLSHYGSVKIIAKF
jgi:uncharacterized protein with beta-barrel porin domain